jgi:hypothetical protein
MRKKLLLLFIWFIVLAAKSQQIDGQKPFLPYHDIRIGVGYEPFEADKIKLFNFTDFFYIPDYFSTKDYYSGARFTTNSWFVEYVYQFSPKFGFGATMNYLSYYNNYFGGSTDEVVGRNLTQHFSLYPVLRMTWYRTHNFSAFSTVGLGARYITNFDMIHGMKTLTQNWGISGQLTLFGFTLGKNVYGFCDFLTLGSQGMLHAGIGYRFQLTSKRE